MLGQGASDGGGRGSGQERAKIEAHYLNRDPSINKEGLLKQAVSNKNAAFKMVKGQNQVEAGRFCKASFNDLVGKLREIDPASAAGKNGS